MDIQEILDRYPKQPQYLIEILIDLDQVKRHHYITERELEMIANQLDVKVSHVCSVMSFYTLLSTEPRGEYVVQVCKEVPCYLNDAFNVLRTVEDILGISLGGTTEDRRFSLEETACIGCCDQAPAMRINHQVYTNLTEDKLYDIFTSLGGDSHA